MKNPIFLVLTTAVVVGTLAFFSGMQFQKMQTPASNLNQSAIGQRRFGQNNPNGAPNNRPLNGIIESVDADSLTIKTADGSNKIVLLSDKTIINESVVASKSSLAAGKQVLVTGVANTDGSVTAVNVSLNPMFMGGERRMPNQSQKSADAKEIVISGSNYAFTPNTITVNKGQKTRIVFKNSGGMHDFKVDELNISTAVIPSGQEDFVEFTADKVGQFQFYCSVGNHRQMGMVGTITVQ